MTEKRMTSDKYISDALTALGAASVGFCDARQIPRIHCRAEQRIPGGTRTLITALFGYYSGEHPERSICKYAIPDDYHTVVGDILRRASGLFAERFPGERFEPFCDVSPFLEVRAAQLSGLGVVGKNGLLISPVTGLYHFIGEIATTMTLPLSEPIPGSCLGCDRCLEACPTGALKLRNHELCLSLITQRKGELTEQEQRLISASGIAWGCDVCMDVCPMRVCSLTAIPQFLTGLDPVITSENAASLIKRKAWGYRGIKVILRNLALTEGRASGERSPDD